MTHLNLSLAVSPHTKRPAANTHADEPPTKDQKKTEYFSQTIPPPADDRMDEVAASASSMTVELERLQGLIDSFEIGMNADATKTKHAELKKLILELDLQNNMPLLSLTAKSGKYKSYSVFLIFMLGNNSKDDHTLVKSWCENKIITPDFLTTPIILRNGGFCSVLSSLAHNNMVDYLVIFIACNFITVNMLQEKDSYDQNVVFIIAFNKQWLLLQNLLDKNLLSVEFLNTKDYRDTNVVHFIAANKQWLLLQNLLDKNLLSVDMLNAKDKYGGNAILCIKYYKQWQLLQNLLDKNLLSIESLEAMNEYGVNSIRLIASHKQWQLLQSLLDKNLLSVDTLKAIDQSGVNAIWLIAYYQPLPLLQNLLDKGLLTADALATPTALTPNGALTYPTPGLGLQLAAAEKWELLETFFTKKLLDVTDLTRAWSDKCQGQSAIELIASKKLPLLKKLLADKDRILVLALEDRPEQQEALLTTLFQKFSDEKNGSVKEETLFVINTLLQKTHNMGEDGLILLDRALKISILTKENSTVPQGRMLIKAIPYSAEEKKFMNLIVDKYPKWTGAPLHSEQGKFLALCHGPAGYPRALSVVLQHQAMRQLDQYLPKDLTNIIESYVD